MGSSRASLSEISHALNALDKAVNDLAYQLKTERGPERLSLRVHVEAIVHLHQMHFRITDCRGHFAEVERDLCRKDLRGRGKDAK